MRKKYYLDMARKASTKSDHPQYKIGCVIARGNEILGIGFNVLRTHPKSPHSHKSIHAEFMAAMNAGYKIKGATAYVFRQHKDGTWAMAKPCKYCWNFLLELGVKEAVYSFGGSYVQEKIA